MNQKFLQWIVSLLFILSSSLHLKAKAQEQEAPVLEQIRETGLVNVALREDAFPFSYKDGNGNFSGICLELIDLIVEQIKKETNREILLVKIYESSLSNRFELVEDNIAYLECGPNTINPQTTENIQYSNPFFITATQLFISARNRDRTRLNLNFGETTIGVLRNSTTQQLIAQKYPVANLQEFQGINGRRRGIQAVQQNKIDAFASDNILLIGEASQQGLILERDYFLVPQEPLECVNYGLILPQNNPQWRNLINTTIQREQLLQIYRRWFGAVNPRLREISEYCRDRAKK
jgi:polar amino acid transport system substrate-binding protein